MMTKNEYIKQMYAILSMMCSRYSYHNVAAAMIAQSIQEGWNSQLATLYHNYWGMKKGTSYNGPTVVMDNKQKTDKSTYRIYSSMEDGCNGYFEFLKYPRYKTLKGCRTDTEYLDMIGPCGWNSNPGYGDRCKSHLADVYSALRDTQLWTIGSTYTTQQDLNVRIAPNGELLPYDMLTPNAKLHSLFTSIGSAILQRGTRVTVKEIYVDGNTTWLRIPSGWICGKNSKHIYVI